jgi:hypothetical protein
MHYISLNDIKKKDSKKIENYKFSIGKWENNNIIIKETNIFHDDYLNYLLIMKELKILTLLKSPHVLNIYGIAMNSSEEPKKSLVYENEFHKDQPFLMTLGEYINKHVKLFSMDERKSLVLQLLDAIIYLNETCQIYHGNLTLSNILVIFKNPTEINNVQFKICNFEYSFTSNKTEEYQISPPYPPSSRFTVEQSIWSDNKL